MQSFFASGTFSIQDVRLDRLCVYLSNILSDRCGQSVSVMLSSYHAGLVLSVYG